MFKQLTDDLNLFNDLSNLVYPKICVSCHTALFKHETYICNRCMHTLPRPSFHKNIEDSIIRKTLYGRVPVFGSAAYYLYSKKTGVQRILHHIKYKQGKELATQIGQWMGYELNKTEWIKNIDGIVPVPLHPKKLVERGYNQSEEYCKGLSAELNKPILNLLKKDIYTSTQTKKRRYERWENVKDNFEINQDISNIQHIALADDVMTTGATFEAAYNALKIAGYKGNISIITIAMATHLI